MAHREYHEQEVESLRRSVKEESEAKVGLLGSKEGQVRQSGSRADVRVQRA